MKWKKKKEDEKPKIAWIIILAKYLFGVNNQVVENFLLSMRNNIFAL